MVVFVLVVPGTWRLCVVLVGGSIVCVAARCWLVAFGVVVAAVVC